MKQRNQKDFSNYSAVFYIKYIETHRSVPNLSCRYAYCMLPVCQAKLGQYYTHIVVSCLDGYLGLRDFGRRSAAYGPADIRN